MQATIVVGYDLSPAGELALDEAARAAERRPAALTVVHAYRSRLVAPPPFQMPLPGYTLRDAAQRIAEQGADRIRGEHPGLAVQAQALHGPAAAVLAEAAADAELLVVGHRGHGGFPGLGLGSVAERTVTRSSVPTLVARGGRHRPRGSVVAAIDIVDPVAGADAILDFAFTEAAQRAAGLKAISAWEILWPPAYFADTGQLRQTAELARDRAQTALARLLQPWKEQNLQVHAEHQLADGDPTTVLVSASTYADLVVVGARRRDGQGVRLGPIAHTLLRHADCPVAVVPHD